MTNLLFISDIILKSSASNIHVHCMLLLFTKMWIWNAKTFAFVVNLSYRPLGHNINVLSPLLPFINTSFNIAARVLCYSYVCFSILYFFASCLFRSLKTNISSESSVQLQRLWDYERKGQFCMFKLHNAQSIGATWHYRTDADLTKCHTLQSSFEWFSFPHLHFLYWYIPIEVLGFSSKVVLELTLKTDLGFPLKLQQLDIQIALHLNQSSVTQQLTLFLMFFLHLFTNLFNFVLLNFLFDSTLCLLLWFTGSLVQCSITCVIFSS